MVFYGFLWFRMVFYAFLWFPMVFHGFLWFRVVFYGFLWFSMVFYGFLWFSWFQVPIPKHIREKLGFMYVGFKVLNNYMIILRLLHSYSYMVYCAMTALIY